MISDRLPLSGSRVLVVEDDMMQALLLGDMVTELGGKVSMIASRLDQALEALDQNEIDCAILDVNLGGTLSHRLAAALRRRDIPFLYCTAYVEAASVFPPIATAPRLGKPVQKDELRETLVRILDAAKS
jgi:two-component SAPR family response regulator